MKSPLRRAFRCDGSEDFHRKPNYNCSSVLASFRRSQPNLYSHKSRPFAKAKNRTLPIRVKDQVRAGSRARSPATCPHIVSFVDPHHRIGIAVFSFGPTGVLIRLDRAGRISMKVRNCFLQSTNVDSVTSFVAGCVQLMGTLCDVGLGNCLKNGPKRMPVAEDPSWHISC